MLLRQVWEGGDTTKLQALLDEMRPKPDRVDFRGFETHYIDRPSAHAEIDATAVRYQQPTQSGSHTFLWDDPSAPGRFAVQYSVAANRYYTTFTVIDRATGAASAAGAPRRSACCRTMSTPAFTIRFCRATRPGS